MTDHHDSDIDVHPVCDACWNVERPKLLNASERAIEFGLDPKKTLAKLVAGKRGLDGLGPDPESPLIVRGHALEDDALAEIQKLRPTWRISPNTNHYVSRKHRIGAIPDATVIDPAREGIGVLQIKVVSAPVFRREWSEGPPMPPLLQNAQEMILVPGCTWGAVGVLVVGDFTWSAFVYDVPRNRKAEIRLLTSAAAFWQAFDAGDLPSVDFERDGDLIALLYPTEIPGKIVDLSQDNAIGDLLERREILRQTVTDIEKRLKAAETEIKAKIGDAETALVPGWRLTFKTQRRAGYTVEPTSYRVLRSTRADQKTA